MDEAQRQRDAHLELSRTVPGPGLPLRFLQTRPAPIPPSAWQRFHGSCAWVRADETVCQRSDMGSGRGCR
jgi:hypothetical protein